MNTRISAFLIYVAMGAMIPVAAGAHEQAAGDAGATKSAASKSAAAKTSPTSKTAKKSIKSKSRSVASKSKTKANVVAAQPQAVQSPVQAAPAQVAAYAQAPAPVVAQKTGNPYLASTTYSDNPYLSNYPANPYLAYKQTRPYQPAQASLPFSGFMSGTAAATSSNGKPSSSTERKHLSLAPLPVDIYMNPGMRPAVAFTTPCVTVAKLTNNFPPIMAMESFMFDTIGRINESEALPFSIEPVCT